MPVEQSYKEIEVIVELYEMENQCLGAHAGSLNKNLVACTLSHNLRAPGDWAPLRVPVIVQVYVSSM